MWKLLRSVNSLVSGAQGRTPNGSGGADDHALTKRPSRDDVLQGFRLILGRELRDESTVTAHMSIPTVAELRLALLNSPEFHGKYKTMNPDTGAHPSLSVGRDALVLLHLEKTGGTSLRTMLERQFPFDRRCPVRDNNLHLISAAELGRYDFFSGHFDRLSLRYIPRDNLKTVVMFREPRARLISYYRFLKAHPLDGEFASHALIPVAHESTIEEFFERPEPRSYPTVFNHYLIALGASFPWFGQNRMLLSRNDLSRVFEAAKAQIAALTALGITERFAESVRCIFAALNLELPATIENVHATDGLPQLDARFRRVEPVEMTQRLDAALQELTEYDQELYRLAVEEFDRRYDALTSVK